MGAIDRAIASSVPAIPKPIVRRVSSRYIAGERIEEAVDVIRDLNRAGCAATVDVLGEDAKDEAQAQEKLAGYKQVIDALQEHGLDSGLSVKLTGLGLTLDYGLCMSNLEEIIFYAAERDRFVRVDMEGSEHTAATVQMVLDVRERHPNTGAVIQAYLRRSLKDVVRLAESGASVRLTKGIYDEPRELAYKDSDVVRENYVLLMEELMRSGCYVAVATHDEYLVWHALRLIHQLKVPADLYELQTLLGVDEQLRDILVAGGHRVRVYVPFGGDWYGYSTRRLKENPRIARYVTEDVIRSLARPVRR